MEQSRIEAYFAAQKQTLLDDICRVVRIKSDKGEALPGKPFGEGPVAALEEMLYLAESMGFRTKNYENYVGTVDFNTKQTQLAILAHLDVVPAGNDWTVTQPFDPVIQDGKLYGRGTSDDKGPAVVALYALKAVKDLGVSLQKNVRLIVGTDEECGSADIAYYYSKEKEDPMTFSPDASFPVINIEKARLVGTLSATFSRNDTLPRVKQMDAGVKENVVHDVAKAVVEGLAPEKLVPFLRQAEEQTGAQFTV
ncbi:MAG: Sapep family Mn(2+)-dependent dipeptidase, partial [Ethanoligenens sp.]